MSDSHRGVIFGFIFGIWAETFVIYAVVEGASTTVHKTSDRIQVECGEGE